MSKVTPRHSAISTLLGTEVPILPGESPEEYTRGLAATIQELDAATPLQQYLAQKMFDCMWWIRRYELQKRQTVIRKMAQALKPPGEPHTGVSEVEAHLMQALSANDFEDLVVLKALEKHHLTPDSLLEEALRKSSEWLADLDARIALKLKTLAGFQGSYEVLVNRKVNTERLRLQNELIRRDLGAIEMQTDGAE